MKKVLFALITGALWAALCTAAWSFLQWAMLAGGFYAQ